MHEQKTNKKTPEFLIQRSLEEDLSNIIVSTVSADALAPAGVWTSAYAMMTEFGSHMYTGQALEVSYI